MMAPGSPYLTALLEAARHDITEWMQARFEFQCGRVGEKGGVTGVVELAKRRLAKRRLAKRRLAGPPGPGPGPSPDSPPRP